MTGLSAPVWNLDSAVEQQSEVEQHLKRHTKKAPLQTTHINIYKSRRCFLSFTAVQTTTDNIHHRPRVTFVLVCAAVILPTTSRTGAWCGSLDVERKIQCATSGRRRESHRFTVVMTRPGGQTIRTIIQQYYMAIYKRLRHIAAWWAKICKKNNNNKRKQD